MVIGTIPEEVNHVKFVSYTGKYPTLCSGLLTLEIDGEEVVFGYKYKAEITHHRTPDYPPFWTSGGFTNYCVNKIEKGEWNIHVDELPDKYKKYAREIDVIFNANVEHGCCGGCL